MALHIGDRAPDFAADSTPDRLPDDVAEKPPASLRHPAAIRVGRPGSMELLDKVDRNFERDEANDREFKADRAAPLDYR